MRNPLHGMRKLQRFGLLLSVLLLLAQTTSLLHAHDLDQHPDNVKCHLCLHSSAHDHALTGNGVLLPTAMRIGTVRIEFIPPSFCPAFTASYHSRAPPRFS